MLKNLTIVS